MQSTRIRCTNCNRTLLIKKKEMYELKCPKCGKRFLWDPKSPKTLIMVADTDGKKG